MNWKWQEKIYIFDDVVDSETQKKLKSWLLGGQFPNHFPWWYAKDITSAGSTDARPAMKHFFMHHGKVTSNQDLSLINQLLSASLQRLFEQTQQKATYELFNSRTFLQFPLNNLNGPKADSAHVDTMKFRHLSILYYVIDSDGETIIYDQLYSIKNTTKPSLDQLTIKQKVMPKQGRVVIFDGFHWHTATQPRNNIRCVINSNVIASHPQ